MRDGWRMGTFADVVKLDFDKVEVRDGQSYPIAGVLGFGRGLLRREPVTSQTTSYRQLNRVRPDQLVYSKLKAFEGAITVAPRDLAESFASSEFPTFTCTEEVEPAYLRLLTQQPSFWADLAGLSKGLGGRRERLAPQDLLSLKLRIPPLSEQRRIVDLIGALDGTIAAMEGQVAALGAAQPALIGHFLSGSDQGPVKQLGDIGTFVRGRRFTKSDYVDSGLGCIHYGQVHTSFGPVAREALTFLPVWMRQRMRLANPGDVVIAATSENVIDLGKATVWMGEDPVAVHDDCYILRHDLDPVFAAYIFRSKAFEEQKQRFAAGTKVTRISAAGLASIRIPIPSLSRQKVIGGVLNAAQEEQDLARAAADRLRSVRCDMLASLLLGVHEIPKSYDLLMEVAT